MSASVPRKQAVGIQLSTSVVSIIICRLIISRWSPQELATSIDLPTSICPFIKYFRSFYDWCFLWSLKVFSNVVPRIFTKLLQMLRFLVRCQLVLILLFYDAVDVVLILCWYICPLQLYIASSVADSHTSHTSLSNVFSGVNFVPPYPYFVFYKNVLKTKWKGKTLSSW